MAKLAGRYEPFPEWGSGEDDPWRAQEEALGELMEASRELPEGEIVGAVISFPVADGKAFYIVTKASPLTVKVIDFGDGYQISAAHLRGIKRSDIEDHLRRDRAMHALFAGAQNWWEQQPLGAIVHYHNGFGQYVRGQIVVDDEGQKAMLPLGLVGEWENHELGRRWPDGRVSHGYHAKKVMEGTVFRPHSSNMFENPEFRVHEKWKAIDPTKLQELDLSVPEMTDDEQEIARLYALCHDVVQLLNERVTPENVAERLEQAREKLQQLGALA